MSGIRENWPSTSWKIKEEKDLFIVALIPNFHLLQFEIAEISHIYNRDLL